VPAVLMPAASSTHVIIFLHNDLYIMRDSYNEETNLNNW